uniref:RING-type E3 ubiquitin transferase n=1 Tax=Davidia involucrata TaxID=16924 RepID=A0A5B6YSL9_DAVIN
MGSLCCCFHVPDVGENVDVNGSNNGNCVCPSCYIQRVMNKYGALFGRGEMHAIPSAIQGAASSNSTVAPNNRPSETNRSCGGHLPSNANSRNSQLQQVGVVMRHGKGIGHSLLVPELLRRSNVQISPKLLSGVDRHYCEGGSKDCISESSVKVLSAKTEIEVVYPSSEDEDVCPTCLEEYIPENPKIITQCSHHYHLSCIYEWMERSENCPVCGKLMIFDQTT